MICSTTQIKHANLLLGLKPFTQFSPDSPADSLEQPPAQNGGHTEPAREGREKEAKKKGAEEDSRTAGPSRGREDVGSKSQHKVQVRSFHTGKLSSIS